MFLPESFLRFHAAADLLFFSILIAARYHDLLGAPDQDLYSRSIKVPTWAVEQIFLLVRLDSMFVFCSLTVAAVSSPTF
jgi:hypothetical protein